MGLVRWIAFISTIVVFAVIVGAVFSSQPPVDLGEQHAAGERQEGQFQGKNNNALWDQWAPDSNVFLVLFTAILAVTSIIQFHFIRRAEHIAVINALAAKASADATKSTLVASQRAWIRTDEIALGGGGLVFDKNGASVAVSFKITNVGNSPAIHVTQHAWLIVLQNGGPFAYSELQRKSAEVRNQPLGTGFTLFPGETFPRSVGIDQWSLGVNISRAELEKGLAVSSDGKHVALQIYGFIDYTFATDDKAHHQTGFVFDLQKKTAALISPDDRLIAVSQLHLMVPGTGLGQFAD